MFHKKKLLLKISRKFHKNTCDSLNKDAIFRPLNLLKVGSFASIWLARLQIFYRLSVFQSNWHKQLLFVKLQLNWFVTWKFCENDLQNIPLYVHHNSGITNLRLDSHKQFLLEGKLSPIFSTSLFNCFMTEVPII